MPIKRVVTQHWFSEVEVKDLLIKSVEVPPGYEAVVDLSLRCDRDGENLEFLGAQVTVQEKR